MKKMIGMTVVLLVTIVAVQAQDYEALDRYMKKYCQNWDTGYLKQLEGQKTDTIRQLGQPMPAFHFTRQLNSKQLRGKFVVLNFWATWCSGCRILSCDIDTVMRRDPGVYEGVQVIGVDAQEGMVDKGYKAEKWWKSKGIGYPTVGGKEADSCCASVNGGHPTAILVDDRGIIRGRWDAWSPGVAEAIHLAIWALKVMPEQGIRPDIETVKSYMTKGEMRKALYLLELMPENKDNLFLRYKCMMSVDAQYAVAYFEKLKQKYEADKPTDNGWWWTPSDEYIAVAREIADFIYASLTDEIKVLKNGVDAIQVAMMARKAKSCTDYEKLGVLRIRYAEAYKQRGIDMLKMAVEAAEDKAEIERLENKLKLYRK